MLNVNRVMLLGHAGRDPDIRELRNGRKAAAFTLATAKKWKDPSGEPVESTQWHRVVVYGPAASAVGKLLRKGAPVLVEGELATRDYSDRDGVKRQITEVIVSGPQGLVSVLPGRFAKAHRTRENDDAPESAAA